MTEIPELKTKIDASVKSDEKKYGPGVDIRNLLNILGFFGVWGRNKKSLRKMVPLIYKLETFEYDDLDGNRVVKLKDEFEYNRWSKIADGIKLIGQRELDYLKLCIEAAFGKDLAKTVTDSEIIDGDASKLVRRLLGGKPELKWSNIDPISALRGLIATSGSEASLDCKFDEGSMHWTDDDGDVVAFAQSKLLSIAGGEGFSLYVQSKYSKTAPIVIEFSETLGIANGKAVRAKLLPDAKKIDRQDPSSNWRISNSRGKPLKMGHQKGKFGWLLICGIGKSTDQLFGVDADPKILSNADLKVLFENLSQSFSGVSPIKLKILDYIVE